MRLSVYVFSVGFHSLFWYDNDILMVAENITDWYFYVQWPSSNGLPFLFLYLHKCCLCFTSLVIEPDLFPSFFRIGQISDELSTLSYIVLCRGYPIQSLLHYKPTRFFLQHRNDSYTTRNMQNWIINSLRPSVCKDESFRHYRQWTEDFN